MRLLTFYNMKHIEMSEIYVSRPIHNYAGLFVIMDTYFVKGACNFSFNLP